MRRSFGLILMGTMAVLMGGCVSKVFAPTVTSTPDPFGCDSADLTDAQRAVCGVHVYDVRGEIVGDEDVCGTFIMLDGETMTFEAEQEWTLAFDVYWLRTSMMGAESMNEFHRRDEDSYWMEKAIFLGDLLRYVITFNDEGYEMVVSAPDDTTYVCKHFVYQLK